MANVGDDWLSGVLSKRQVKELCKVECIRNASENESAYDYSSFELHLTEEAYRLTRGSVKPFGDEYLKRMQKDGLIEPIRSKDKIFNLSHGSTYLFKLQETLSSKMLIDNNIYGQATAKSSIGRVDVLVRLIVDGMRHYEAFDHKGLRAFGNSNVSMYVEVTPITFDVRVKAGIALNQLRLFKGRPRDCELPNEHVYAECLRNRDGQDITYGELSVNLNPTVIKRDGKSTKAVAFKARDNPNKPINLWKSKKDSKPDPDEFWDVPSWENEEYFEIEKDIFYILRSEELIALPNWVAVYARAIDEEIGEMRIHYAGFVHPFFGYNRKDMRPGTPLIFEVRGHNVKACLTHRERMARLRLFHMSEDAEKEEDKEDPYQNQELKLSTYFGDWK